MVPCRSFHLMLVFIQFSTAIIMGVLSTSNSTQLNLMFYKWDESQLFYRITANAQYMCIVFIALSGFFHLYIAYFYESYKERVPKFSIHERWIEYSLSASLMHVVICMQVGVHDIITLICVFVLTQLCMATGFLLEMYMDRYWFYVGCYPFVVVWAIIITAFGVVVSNETPWFVYMIVIGIGFFDSLFALNAIYLLKSSNRIRSEWIYCLLSISSKQLLVWLTFEGARQQK